MSISVTATGSGGALGALFGDGADGDVTIAGTVTLARDMYYRNLTIPVGTVLKPNGWRVFVREAVTIEGQINQDGPNDGTWPDQNTVGRGQAGGAGATGAGVSGAGGSTDACLGGSSGAGGNGPNAGAAGVTSPGTQAAKDATRGIFATLGSFAYAFNIVNQPVGRMVQGGVGGSSGGGDGTNSSRAGGSGGGVIVLAARAVQNNGTIRARGGSPLAPSAGNVGGSGGGGGGVVLVSCLTYAGSGTVDVAGGTGSAGVGTGTAGGNGSAGFSRINTWA